MPFQHVRTAVVVLLATVAPGWLVWRPQSAAPPVAQILAPDSGVKFRKGQTAPVTIRVEGGDDISWAVSLHGPGDTTTTLATGTGAVKETNVAEIDAGALRVGESYTLMLDVTSRDIKATAVASFTIPDPQYTLIPLTEGNLSQLQIATYAVDAAGDQIIYAIDASDPAGIALVDRRTGKREVLRILLENNEGFKFSGDGARLFFPGRFRQGDFVYFGVGYLDLRSRMLTFISELTTPFFTVDNDGARIAYQVATGSDASGDDIDQYFLYDEATGETRQLTDDPAAIDFFNLGPCPFFFASTPLISADGATIVIITAATLGIVPDDPSVSCRVFSYNVASQTFKQVAALPQSVRRVGAPALSADGRWLSFAVARGSGSVPALMDVQTGDLRAPIVDVGDFTSFDSAVTPNGDAVIISTEADLDPRVGNADHNMELFYYDRVTGQATQISETRAGIGQTPGGCEQYRPSVSQNGAVLVFAFQRISVERCHLDGIQRNEADGFAFGFVRAVRKRPGNSDVLLDAVSGQRVVAGERLTINLTAHDADGDPISFFAQVKDGDDVPAGSTITDHHDGTAAFTWPTKPEDTGDHVLRFAAFDEGGGEMFQDVTISVVPHGVSCTGDCNGDRQVTVDELLTGVGIALGTLPPSACAAYDHGGTQVTIDELLVAVDNALTGCR